VKTDRIQAFSDGVFSILITILVLEFILPVYHEGHLASAVLRQWPILFSYVISYIYIGILWLFHHDLFNTVKVTTIMLNVLNLFSLFAITLLNYATSLLSESLVSENKNDLRFSVCVYAILACVISMSYLFFYLYLHFTPAILKDEGRGLHFKKALKYPFVSMSLYLLAILFSFFQVYCGLGLLICGIFFHGFAYYQTAKEHGFHNAALRK
jgi:uncharacterized membrane protein